MTIPEVIDNLKTRFGGEVLSAAAEGLHPHVEINARRLREVGNFLKTYPVAGFNQLRCVSAVDRPSENVIEMSYELASLSTGLALAIKVRLDRAAPEVESVSAVWPAANWHEREAFDLMGVRFINHPDPRRILMPEDWVGHPLRKDYQDPVEYHGLKINP